MKRSFPAILILLFIFPFADGQIWKAKRYEASFGLGPSFFFGDIGGFSNTKNILGLKDITIKQTRYNFNLNFKYRIAQDINLRLSLEAGAFHATDARGSNVDRGYEVSQTFFEPALIAEYYFIKNKAENSYLFTKGKRTGFLDFIKFVDFYVFTGVGGVSTSLKPNARFAQFGGRSPGFSAVIPVGLGSTLIYSPDFNFGLEVAGRYASTDYLDGYTSQYSSSNDVYYFFNLTITYKVKTGPKGRPSFR